MTKLLTKSIASAKMEKNDKLFGDQYQSYIVYLAPATIVKGVNMCPAASAGCKSACLFTAGRGRFSNVKKARIKRTVLFRDDRETFVNQLVKEVDLAIKRARKASKQAVFRFNGTSDIDWEAVIREFHPYFYEEREDSIFYEYTKRPDLAVRTGPVHYTVSKSESNIRVLKSLLSHPVNFAVVFEKIPDIYMGRKVISGDLHDLRFLDPKGVIVGLTAKGDAKKDQSGFVVRSVT